MKSNIQYLIITLLFPVLTILPGVAQNHRYKGEIIADSIRLEQRGEFVHIDMDFILNNLKMKSQQGITMIPVLTFENHVFTLPEVLIKGQNEYLAYERELTLMSKKKRTALNTPYTVEKGNKFKKDTLNYRYMLPYEPWMADAHVDVQFDHCGCGETALMEIVPVGTISPEVFPYLVTPYPAFIQPEAEEIKRREIQVETFLDFEVNKTNIRPEYMNNPRELAKIYAMIDELKNDKDIEINRLDIIGYASPEGTLAGNKRLSEGRARALRDYLATQYDFSPNLYHIVFGGENWRGLTAALDTLPVEYKDEVIDIVENTADIDLRKTRLKQLHGGTPYRYLLKNVYPNLRVAVCKASYRIKNFDLNEAKEVIKTRPQNLSLNEMFLVANSYDENSQEFMDVFETAVRMYPHDEIANLNAASSAILRNDLISAERYLGRINPEKYVAEYNNVMGILALLNNQYDKAEIYLKSAADTGLEAAKFNLEELKKKRENEFILKKRSESK